MINILLVLIYTFFSFFANAEKISDINSYKKTKLNFKITKLSENKLNYPWGMTFVDSENILITEKKGNLLKLNISTGEIIKIDHPIPIYSSGQGGLLDVFSHSDGFVYFTYSHDFGKNKRNENISSTGIGRGILSQDKITNFEVLLTGKPNLNTNKHWGARIAIKEDLIYVGFGERDYGMIAQDPQKHPGSIIRIKTDGSIPKDNPSFKGYEEWLPEIFQIGMRNPQGITVSPYNGEVYFSQHGPMGGDNIGKVSFAGNFGWKDVAWGGKEYSGKKIGTKPFKSKYNKNIITWVPSIAIGNIAFYNGKIFPEWEGSLIFCATKAKLLGRLKFENDNVVKEEIIIKDIKKIGRIRDFEIDMHGNIFIISDEGKSALWMITRD